MKLNLLATLLICLLFVQCNSAQKIKDVITKNTWRIVEVDGMNITNEKGFVREPEMQFGRESNRVTGNAGCNLFQGRFEFVGNNQINFSQLLSTKMACENMRVEDRFMKAIEKVNRYGSSRDTIVLSNDDIPLIKLVLAK